MGALPGDSLLSADSMVDHYRVLQIIGRGGMGEVYLARDTKLGRRVVLKLIHPRHALSTGATARLLEEARITASFNHPHIVTVYGVGEHQGSPYLALEYVDGQTLRQRMNEEQRPLGWQKNRVAVKEVMRIGLAIAQALAEAHRNRILHRDLKPENVMLGRDGRLRVLDLGLAKLLTSAPAGDTPVNASKALPAAHAGEMGKDGSGTESGTGKGDGNEAAVADTMLGDVRHQTSRNALAGTPLYIAPEGWRGSPITEAADIWALGVVLYELLAGRHPYQETRLSVLTAAVASPSPAPPLPLGCAEPEELRALVAACLEKAPEARPTAADVVGRLERQLIADRGELSEQDSPFRGLLPFGERHAAFFFGRDAEVGAFLESMREQAVLPEVGPSASGKSSFVQAGVIPRLREQGRWVVLLMRPGADPFAFLAATMRRGDAALVSMGAGRWPSASEAVMAGELGGGPHSLNLELHRLAEAENSRVLLFVDQLEEVCTLVKDERVRRRFVESICGAVDDPRSPVRVVFTIRDDFLGRIAEGNLAAEVLRRVMVVKRPGPEMLREVLVQPLERLGYRYEDAELVDKMIASVRGEPACLPLLQFACRMLWERRDKGRLVLSRAAYEAMGGVAGALAEHADGVLEGLTPDEARSARELLLRLVTAEGTRRVVPVAQALDGLDPRASDVLRRFTRTRLLTVRQEQGDDSGGTTVVELAHESLVLTWGRLARWLDESRDELAFSREAAQAAELWCRRGRRDEEVWQGEALADARRKLTRLQSKAPEQVTQFVAAGLRKEKRQRQRRRALAAGAMALLAAVAALSLLRERETRVQKERAEAERQRAETREAEAQREGARAAFVRGDMLEARAKLRGSLEAQDSLLGRTLWWRLERDPLVWRKDLGAAVTAVTFSPDGKTVAAAANTRLVHLFEVDTQRVRFLRGLAGDATSLAFAPDGQRLAAGTVAGAIALFDLDKRVTRTVAGHSNVVWGLAFSPNGRQLASASEDRTVRIWDTDSAKLVRVLAGDESAIRGVAFGPDGSSLAYHSARLVHLLDVATWSEKKALAGNHGTVCGLAFSSDGSWLAGGASDGSILLWDATTGSQRAVLVGHATSSVRSLAASKDNRTVASGNRDGSIRVWDVTTGRERNSLLGHRSLVYSVSFSPDGSTLASGSADESMKLWRVAIRPPGKNVGHQSTVRLVAFSPDSRLLASAGNDSSVRIWDAATGSQLQTLQESAGDFRGVAFSPDGRLLAAGNSDGSILVWDSDFGTKPRAFPGHRGAASGVAAVAFSRDGSTVFSVGPDKTVRLWDPTTGRERQTLTGHAGIIESVATSPDGRFVASCSYDRTIRIWDAHTGILHRVLEGHEDLVLEVDFAPNSKLLASASCDRTVRLWNLATGVSRTIGEHAGNVYSVAFHPDGRHVGTASVNGVAYIWDSETGKHVSLRGHRRDVLSIRFSPDGRIAATTSEDGTVRLFDVENATPIWRAPVLVRPTPGSGSAIPEAFTHLGWTRLQEPDRTATATAVAAVADAVADARSASTARSEQPVVEWRRAVETRAITGAVAPDPGISELLCLRTNDDHLQGV
ncbi:MAG: protein kinase [Pseudomonadota bacterium]